MTLAVDDPRHGTMNGYHNQGCRCEQCKAAWAAYCLDKGYVRRYRQRVAGPCSVDGCERPIALSHPRHRLCWAHLKAVVA